VEAGGAGGSIEIMIREPNRLQSDLRVPLWHLWQWWWWWWWWW